MTSTMTIRVHYPLERGALTLRLDPDWERDLDPVDGDAVGGRFDFRVRLDAPFRYFKPVLHRDDGVHWSLGENCLAVRNGHDEMDVYPFFFDTLRCSACTLHELELGGRRHAVRVFYPGGYAENCLERFPVVYMHDGQNLFFPGEAFGGHDWKVPETLGVLEAMSLIRRVLVVGIYPQERTVDYTLPGYGEYGRFLVERVKPWVDHDYRTLDGARYTAVMGSSLGGVASLCLAWEHPEVFGHAACLSSTFGWRDDLFARIACEPRRDVRIYLDSGWPGDNYEVTRAMRDLLLDRGYVAGRDLMYLAFPHARHDERAWSMRAHVPLQHFFGR